MARTGQKKTSDEIEIEIGILTHVFPQEVIRDAIEEEGSKEKRRRQLPADIVAYFVLGLALWPKDSFLEVIAKLFEHLESNGKGNTKRPSDAAVTKARYRLGPSTLKRLYKKVVGCVATSETKGAFYKQWRLIAIDGTVFDVPDTAQNERTYGRPVSAKGKSGFPQVRLVGLIEIGTKIIFDAVIGPCKKSEIALSKKLIDSLKEGMLLFADRNFFGYELWKSAADTGADLCWRVKSSNVFKPIEMLEDGSYLAKIYSSDDKKRTTPIVLRVIEYSLLNRGIDGYRLVTTILDPTAAPAKELASLYAQRWEIEQGIGEIKTTMLESSPVLRSKYPAGIAQEIWAILCVHFALRSTMAEIADENDIDPDKLSFINMIKILSRHMANHAKTAAVGFKAVLVNVAKELLKRLLPDRRGRSYPRVLKRVVHSFPVKRAHHKQSSVERNPEVSILAPSKTTYAT